MKLEGKNFAVGVKEARKAFRDHKVTAVYLACNAYEGVVEPLKELAKEAGIIPDEEHTMRELGRASGIEVGAACVVVYE
ncbi:MAG: 50S ribosomal protein L7ae-like protein [Clostridia bacterium]|nr:50S ribosomal protein L7ae-like protein [Clostridia bacterium]